MANFDDWIKTVIVGQNLDADYTTNSPSYYDELARKSKIIELLIKKIWEYDQELAKRFAEWDKNLEEFDEEVKKLLIQWLQDGTLEGIINEAIVKANKNLELRGINVMYPPPPYVAAVGDGVTDDLVPIQTLMNNFNHLYFPEKEFYVSDSLRPTTTNRISGKGTIKGRTGLRFAMVVENVSEFTNVGVGFTVSGLQVLTSQNITIQDGSYLNIIDRPAIELAGVKNFKIHDNVVRDIRMGIHIINSNTGMVTNNLVENIGGGRSNGVNETALGQIAILLWGTSDNTAGSEKAVHHVTVSNNVCRNGSDNGIRLIAEKYHIAYGDNTGRCHDCTVTGNVVEEFYVDGIRVTCDHTTITANTVKNCSYGGIRGNGGIGMVISDNIIQGDDISRFGINMGLVHEHSSGSKLIVGNNYVKGSANGISIFGGKRPTTGEETIMYDSTVIGNQVYDVREVGMTLYKCVGALVNANTVKDSGGSGIDCTGSNMTISNNVLESNNKSNHATYKFGLTTTVDNAVISGNRIFNQLNGVGFVQKGNKVLEFGNMLYNNTMDRDMWTNKDYLPFDVFGAVRAGTRPSLSATKNGDMYFDGNTLRLYVNGEWKFIPLSDVLTNL